MQRIIRSIAGPGRPYCTKANGWSFAINGGLETGKKVSVGGRTVTEDDIKNFAQLTGDHNPIHRTSEKIVHGALLNGFLSGVLGTRLPGPGTVVIEQSIRYPKPCYAGDVIEITVEVLSMRKIIKCGYRIVANSERTVLEGEGKFVMNKFGVK